MLASSDTAGIEYCCFFILSFCDVFACLPRVVVLEVSCVVLQKEDIVAVRGVVCQKQRV